MSSQFVQKILQESQLLSEAKIVSFSNPNNANFVVMIGSPGAGKSYVVKNLLNLRGFKFLTGDNWIEMVAKKKGYDLQNPEVTASMKGQYDPFFKKFRQNFVDTQTAKQDKLPNIVVEVTGKSVPNVQNALSVIKDMGYKTTLVYVITSKEECLKRNAERIRRVPDDVLLDIYDKTAETYELSKPLFHNVWEVINETAWTAIQASDKPEYIEVNGVKYPKIRKGPFIRPDERIKAVKLTESASQKNTPKYELYVDLDGVLADFSKGYAKLTGKKTPNTHIKDWTAVDNRPGFWSSLDWMPDGKQLWHYVSRYKPNILTSPSTSKLAPAEKTQWVKRLYNMGNLYFSRKSLKYKYAAPNRILIDDYADTITAWRQAGGIGILHTSASNTIAQLKKIGL